ncbi:20917_t:CDS:2 [Gigaspora rosea]|nr:20917_t:CDS:2 [Gigaspora rosea]
MAQQENQEEYTEVINTKLGIRGVITNLRTLLSRKGTEITNLKEEIKTLAINCNLDIESNTTYSGILQQINNITTAQTVNYLRYILEEDYFSTNETQWMNSNQ